MQEVLEMQLSEANSTFGKYIKENYESWLNDSEVNKPLLSHQVMKKKVFPEIKAGKSLFFIVIDNLRFDQWKVLEPMILEHFHLEEESAYFSILPTTTAFARNAIFSGMMPLEMSKKHPQLWENEDTDEGKNNNEEEFLKLHLQRAGIKSKFSYHKVIHVNQGKQLLEQLPNLVHNELNVMVYNFVDMLSHARTDLQMIRELAPDESAYRSLTKSWFEHSPLFDMLKKIADLGQKVIITTDHGTVRVNKPYKIVGDRNVSTNLRYKQGKNLNYESGKIMEVRKPEALHLPKLNVSSSYVFAVEDYFFAYPNNYNYYVNYFKDTFQHGGISLEEMIVPIISLNSRKNSV